MYPPGGVDEHFENKPLKRKPTPKECTHPAIARVPLSGDRDYQAYRSFRCRGNNYVIPSSNRTAGSKCTSCHIKFFCPVPGCVCKS